MPTQTRIGTRPPTNEVGSSTSTGTNVLTGVGTPSWSSLAAGEDSLERTPALLFPQSNLTYADMMNDAQCSGLVDGVRLPLLRMNWYVKKNGAPVGRARRVADDYGLPLEGDDPDRAKGRSKRRFKFHEHLDHALEAMVYGFMYFEQVGDIVSDKHGEDRWRVRKLAPRMPWNIAEVNIAKDGGLVNIRQGFGPDDKAIPVSQLVAYVWGKKGANWFGRSMLRPCYGPYLLKDRVKRVGAINIERNGAGTPIVEAPPDATPDEIAALDRMAQRFKAGSRAGGAIPHGAKMQLMGISGSQPNAEAFIRLCNEEMARAFLMMFMQLGQTETGSRSLGESFLDFFTWKLEAAATWFCEIFNEHVIEDDVDWNDGEEEAAPQLAWSWGDAQIPTADLSNLVSSGVLQVDDELEDAIRQRYRLPARTEPRTTPPTPPALPAADESADPEGETSPAQVAARARGERAGREDNVAASPATLMLPARPLRRQPYDHEIAAAVDYAALDAAWESALDLLAMEVRQLQAYQIDELHDAIVEAAGDLEELAELSAEPLSADVIAGRLTTIADQALNEAIAEAGRQGVTIERPDMEALTATLKARAEAVDTLLTRDLVSGASARAIRLTGGALDPAEVAAEVRDGLRQLAGTQMRQRLGGALTAAQNAGRALVFRREVPERIYASEILDTNTCANCVSKDGTEYTSLDDAERDYPTGGYKDCLGAERCRGTLVAVWGES